MKKLVLLMALAAIPTFASAGSIVGSKHDLSSKMLVVNAANGTNQVCVFCHTPHGSRLEFNVAGEQTLPLWNRSDVDVTTVDLYNSITLNTTYSTPSKVLANSLQGTDLPLCLSCHDGSSMSKPLYNEPNGKTGAGLTNITSNANLFDGTNDLTNDHPIGMQYAALATAEGTGEFKAAVGTKVGTLNLYGSGAVMWCSSCHDVHQGTPSDGLQFMASSMTGSALCLACHVK